MQKIPLENWYKEGLMYRYEFHYKNQWMERDYSIVCCIANIKLILSKLTRILKVCLSYVDLLRVLIYSRHVDFQNSHYVCFCISMVLFQCYEEYQCTIHGQGLLCMLSEMLGHFP
jgi:hypothetical protein